MNNDLFTRVFEENIKYHKDFISRYNHVLADVAELISTQFKKGNKLLLFGNGGSAADAQHLAAEFVNRLLFDRPALPALALTTDTSILTSIANDDTYLHVFSRQIEAIGTPGDVAWGISTSGNSPNVVEAFHTAKRKGLFTVASLGHSGGIIKSMVDHAIIVPASSTQRIQEVHITAGHAICEWVEKRLFSNS
ncbi:MAG: D-sedoheptulose 7-phosphate isomerase [bacterium]